MSSQGLNRRAIKYLGKSRIELRIIAIFLISGLVFYLFRSRSDYGDSLHWISVAPYFGFSIREPLARLLQHLAYLFGRGFFDTPGTLGYLIESRLCIGSLSILVGMFSTVSLYLTTKRFFPVEKRSGILWLAFFGTISTFGILQLFCGYIEAYPILMAACSLYVLAACLYLDERLNTFWVAAILGIGVYVHLSMIFFLPSLVLLPCLRKRRHLSSMIAIIVDFLLVSIALFIVILGIFFNYRVVDFVVLLAQETFADAGSWLSLADAFSLAHVKDYALMMLKLAPVSLAILMGLFLSRPRSILGDKKLLFIASMLPLYMLWAFFWKPRLGTIQDWDLFSCIALPLGMLGFSWLGALVSRATAPRWLLIAALICNIGYSMPLILSNHLKIKTEIPSFAQLSLRRVIDALPEDAAGQQPAMVDISLNQYTLKDGDTLKVSAHLRVGDADIAGDIWSFVELPDGRFLFYRTILLPNCLPFARNYLLKAGMEATTELYRFPFGTRHRITPNDHFVEVYSGGNYTWYILIVDHDTQQVIAGDYAEFTYL